MRRLAAVDDLDGVRQIHDAGARIDHGLDDLSQHEQELLIYTSFQEYGKMLKYFEEKGIEVKSSELQYLPTTTKELSEEQAKEVKELIDKIEEDDDVQSIFHNMVS